MTEFLCLPPSFSPAVPQLDFVRPQEMTRRIGIGSYSLPTDLASELGAWPEFVTGSGYSVDLKSADTGETVTVRFVEAEGEPPEVVVHSPDAGLLFDRVLGRVVYALSTHSDHLMIDLYE